MTFVESASGFARRLCQAESKRAGIDLKQASTVVARRLRLAPTSLWSLMYQPPKSIAADLYNALVSAVETQIKREIEALNEELLQLSAGRLRRDPSEMAEMEEMLARLKGLIARQDALL